VQPLALVESQGPVGHHGWAACHVGVLVHDIQEGGAHEQELCARCPGVSEHRLAVLPRRDAVEPERNARCKEVWHATYRPKRAWRAIGKLTCIPRVARHAMHLQRNVQLHGAGSRALSAETGPIPARVPCTDFSRVATPVFCPELGALSVLDHKRTRRA
jgi:hypothetical protein